MPIRPSFNEEWRNSGVLCANCSRFPSSATSGCELVGIEKRLYLYLPEQDWRWRWCLFERRLPGVMKPSSSTVIVVSLFAEESLGVVVWSWRRRQLKRRPSPGRHLTFPDVMRSSSRAF
ncbi:hypothetical protein CEXT_362431 [Caerostris extrusa]|uniref:Uncharacterized protein n=1 Tax=Caerostris extrusa TaxID=172846 RepID=A0AAV4VG48_CAEEX|nr:hypothetical protein CEXT_362431 [Caerostris extrusa]